MIFPRPSVYARTHSWRKYAPRGSLPPPSLLVGRSPGTLFMVVHESVAGRPYFEAEGRKEGSRRCRLLFPLLRLCTWQPWVRQSRAANFGTLFFTFFFHPPSRVCVAASPSSALFPHRRFYTGEIFLRRRLSQPPFLAGEGLPSQLDQHWPSPRLIYTRMYTGDR